MARTRRTPVTQNDEEKSQESNAPSENQSDEDYEPEMSDGSEEEVFILDPYYGDINPGTSAGRYLFNKATAQLDHSKRIHVSIENSKKVKSYLEELASTYGWGELVHQVNDKNGKPRSIINEYKLLTVEDIQRQSLIYLADNTTLDVPLDKVCCPLLPNVIGRDKIKFYLKVRSKMIAKVINGHFTIASLTNLRNSSDKYRWKDANGQYFDDSPTMLKILLDDCNPSTRVGVEDLKKKIEGARLANFKHNVSKCMDYIKSNYKLILEAEATHDNIVRDIFNALLSTNNSNFHNYFSMERIRWEQGADYRYDVLCESATAIYNNMKASGEWEKVDPKDAKIMALATEIRQLKDQPIKKGSAGNQIDPRRITKKGASITIDGQTLWWCDKHKHPKKFPNGLYMPHKPEDHDEWVKQKQTRKGKKKSPPSTGPSQHLKLKETIKSVLMTNYALSEETAQSIWDDTDEKLGGEDFLKARN